MCSCESNAQCVVFIRSVISVTGGVIGLLSEEETNMQECEEYTV